MAFQKAQNSSSEDVDEFMIEMLNSPKTLKIVEIGEFKVAQHSREGYKFFYVTFEDVETNNKFNLSFNAKVNDDDSVYIGQGAKLYPLLSFVSHIDDEAIVCFKEDIDEALNGLKFKAKTRREKFGRKSYFVLVPISEVVE